MKSLLAILFSVSLFILGGTGASLAQAPGEIQPGITGLFGAYCKDEVSARTLSAIVTRDGDQGYVKFVSANGNECYDNRLQDGVLNIRVTLREKVWTVHHANGNIFEFWTAADSIGDLGYIWFRVYPVKLPGREA